jgi:hypothetical protein
MGKSVLGGGSVATVARRAGAVFALGVVVAASRTAAAQGNGQGAMAEALFRSGRTLMAAENYAEACPKFAESEKIDPKVGTLMNLALCHEKAGLTASAWAEYAQAAELARRSAQAEREAVARQRAAALEVLLTHVVVQGDAKSDAVVTLDGQPVGTAAYGMPMPIDPGSHVLQASAPGMAPFRTTFQVAAGDPDRKVEVPPLSPLAAEASAPAPEAHPEQPAAAGGTHPTRVAGLIVGGAGVVALGVGAFFGVRAFSDKSAAEKACGANFCTPPGTDATNSMKTDEMISTIGVVGGVLAIGAGTYLVLATRKAETHGATARGLAVAVGPKGVVARFEW